MGAPKELHGLTIRGRSDKEGSDVPKSSGNPRIFNIDVSDDNQNWTHAGTFTVENRIENTVYLDHRQRDVFPYLRHRHAGRPLPDLHRRNMGILIRLTNF